MSSILVIDHDIEFGTEFVKVLKTLWGDVTYSSSYDQTVSLLNQKRYDYIVVDLESNTSQFNDMLNYLSITTESKLIILSNSKDTQYKEYLFNKGCLAYLYKKDSITDICETIVNTIVTISQRKDEINNILLVQDSLFSIEHIENTLSSRSYTITSKNRYNDILQTLEDKLFCMVILDLEVEDIDHLKLIKNIDKKIPIIILSGDNENCILEKITQLGVSDIIKKPISSKEFIYKIDFWHKFFMQAYNLESQQVILAEYKDIVDKASIVSKTDPKGRITYVNKNFCKISGYSEYELIGKPHNIVRHPDMPKEAFKDMWNTIKNKKQTWHGKVKNKKKNGDFYIVDTFAKPILDNNNEIKEFIALRNDITEIEQTKEYFKQQHNILGDSLESAMNLAKEYEFAIDNSNIVSRTDLEGNITYINEKFTEVSGYSKEELIGRKHSIVRHPDMKESFFKELWDTILSGKVWTGQIKNRNKAGETYFVNTLIVPIKDKNKKIIEFMAVRHDVSQIIKLHEELENTQKEIIYKMGEIGETRSKETGNHVKRVALYSKLLAQLYGMSSEEAHLLNLASPMHDIGKVGIPDSVLKKPGKLDKEEWQVMQSHSQIGYEMLNHSSRPILKTAAIVAYEHHEKWDGSGYPRGIQGEDIHIYGRITALADVFDALGSHRCYKEAWDDERIFALFKEQRGKHFDPTLVDLFFENLEDFLAIREKFKDS